MFANFFRYNLNRIYLVQCIGLIAILSVVFAILSPSYVSLINLSNILTASAVIGLLAIGETFVIASGAIDLSVATTMALSAVVCAIILQNFSIAAPFAFVIAMSFGAACGTITGLLINITRAPSFIITLGMLSIERAAAYIITGGIPIYGLDERVTNFAQNNLLGIPLPILTLGASALFGYLFLAKSRFGKHLVLFGDNANAAEMMGIIPNRLRLAVFAVAGAFSGLAGFIFMTRTNSGDPTAGQNYELIAITAVVLGGANLYGGRATILGTLAGVLCLGVLQNGLNLMAISTFYQTLFVGIVLVLASFFRRFGKQV